VTSTTRTTRGRVAIAVLVIVAVVSVFVVRLVDIQIVQADSLNAESLASRSDSTVTFGTRGDIVDANGVVLATSILRYAIEADPSAAAGEPFDRPAADGSGDVKVTREQAITELATAMNLDPAVITAILTADPTSRYAVISKSVDVATYNAVRALDIPWLYYKAQQSRTYPDGSVAGNLVGFVAADGSPLAGTEITQDKCLAGSNGSEFTENGEDGTAIPGSTVTRKKAVDGGDVMMTINSDIQYFSQQALAQRVTEVGAESGTAVVMEAKTGKIIAAAEYPSVDPNNIDATDPQYRGAKVFSDPFEPGSTFKSITAASLVDAGAATPDSQVLAPYEYRSGDAVIHDSFYHAPMRWTLTGVIEQSSNTGISMLSNNISVSQRWDYMKKFHLGQPTEVGFVGEDSGDILPGVDDPTKLDDQTIYNTTFGQGLTVTAVQMASAYQAIANNGVRLPVQLFSGCKHDDGTVTDAPAGSTGEQVISAQAANDTVHMMESVATTGYAADALKIPGYRVSAKTGTAEMSDGSGSYGHAYLTSMAGMAPSDDPQFVVSVTIRKPVTITSGLAAAPVFQKVLSQVLKTYRVQPSTVPAPDLPTTY
jgi:cell division protein FtsI (penicillin-binding protein 3)